MNPYYKEKLRGILSDEIASTRTDIAALEESTKPVPPDKGLGRITRMEVLSDKARNEAALEQLKEKLSNIETALATIDEPDFGNCARCKTPIPDERLLALPGARHCMRCAR